MAEAKNAAPATGEDGKPAAAAQASSPTRDDRFVAVGCKLPSGVWLDLDRYEGAEAQSAIPPRLVKGKMPPVLLKGYRTRGAIVSPGGYVVTPVPAAFWEAWVKQNPRNDLIESGMVFAESTPDRALDHSKDHADVPAQFAPITPTRADGVEVATDDQGRPYLETVRAVQGAERAFV